MHYKFEAEQRQQEVREFQARHRARLAESWDLEAGGRILEIGCGQGDMTSVLAEAVVFAHSSWYAASSSQLAHLLETVRPWAKRLCFAEWDLEPHSFDQFAHYLAISIQGQIEAFKTQSTSNVRTPLSKTHVQASISGAGWEIERETEIDAHYLQDADWEIQAALSLSIEELEGLKLPPKYIDLLKTHQEILLRVSKPAGNKSLSVYSLVAS